MFFALLVGMGVVVVWSLGRIDEYAGAQLELLRAQATTIAGTARP